MQFFAGWLAEGAGPQRSDHQKVAGRGCEKSGLRTIYSFVQQHHKINTQKCLE